MKEPCFRVGPCWKIAPAKTVSVFAHALSKLGLKDAMLYIEGGTPAPKDLDSYLRKKAVGESIRIGSGTILPRPTVYRVPATTDVLNDISTIAQNLPTPIGSIHIHIYQDENILLQWFDAFLEPIWVSSEIPESKIKEFSQALGASYTSDIHA